MWMTDLVIPSWCKWAALSLAVAGVFGAGTKTGAWWQEKIDSSQIAAAKLETAQLKAITSTEAAKQASKAVQIAAQQAKTSQEVTNDSTTRARALDARLATGGLRLTASNGGCACRLPSIPGNPGASSDLASQSLPAGSERNPGQVQTGVEDKVLEDAARDSQQLSELIDAAYRLGCAGF